MISFGVVFMIVLVAAVAAGLMIQPRSRMHAGLAPGVLINERLTGVTGALLLLLTLAIGVTILRIGDLLPEHYLVGFLMLGPLGLKLATTGYRFVRYYTRNPGYRQVGPPPLILRLTAPVLVLATVAVFGTGIELWIFGYRFGSWWFQAHVVSFLAWTGMLAIHLVGHTRGSAEAARSDLAGRDPITRRGLVVASVVLGLVLAAASLAYVTPFPTAGSG